MDLFLNNPGLQHIGQTILFYLDHKSLLECRSVNRSWKAVLDNPKFWIKKCRQKNINGKNRKKWIKRIRMKWIKLIQLQKDEDVEQNITMCLIKMQITHSLQSPLHMASEFGFLALVNFLLENLDTNPMKKNRNGFTPFNLAVQKGHARIVETLAHFYDPNAPDLDGDGRTPIQVAAIHGHAEVVGILAPLTGIPNALNPYGRDGRTPIQMAARRGHAEVVKVLAPMYDNPNAPFPDGWTPIQIAAQYGHAEVVKTLVPFSENPNAPDPDGWTPIQWAAIKGYAEVVKLLTPLSDNFVWQSKSWKNSSSNGNFYVYTPFYRRRRRHQY